MIPPQMMQAMAGQPGQRPVKKGRGKLAKMKRPPARAKNRKGGRGGHRLGNTSR